MKITKVKHFLYLLLDIHTSSSQARALLETENPDQVLGLSEIALNLTDNQIPLNIKARSHIKKNQSVLKKLGNRKLTERTKFSIISKQWKLIWKTVIIIRKILIQSVR